MEDRAKLRRAKVKALTKKSGKNNESRVDPTQKYSSIMKTLDDTVDTGRTSYKF
jgi:hypothetical protein